MHKFLFQLNVCACHAFCHLQLLSPPLLSVSPVLHLLNIQENSLIHSATTSYMIVSELETLWEMLNVTCR